MEIRPIRTAQDYDAALRLSSLIGTFYGTTS